MQKPEHATIPADKDKLAQVRSNIIQDSIEAMLEGGDIWISTDTFERDGAVFAQIAVADNGCGIPQEALEKISEPFYTAKLGGIGLSICRKIVQAHGGHLEIKSEEHEGTAIEIILPAT